MRRNNKLFFGLLALVLILSSCTDSLKSRLTQRLENFRKALPGEIREKFDKGEYEEAGRLLDEKILLVRKYIDMMPNEETKRAFIRADYKSLTKEIKDLGIPQDVLDFNAAFWSIQDYECIPTFSGFQVVDYFKVYFKEKLDSMK